MTAAPGAGDADLPAAVVRFCRVLRDAGLAVTPAETIDATRALDVVDLGDRDELRLALRSVLVSRPEDLARFDELFDGFWRASEGRGTGGAPPPRRAPGPVSLPVPGRRRAVPSLQQWLGLQEPAADAETEDVPLMGSQEVLATKDFSVMSAEELEEVARLVRRLARRLARRPSRRWRPARRGERIHPRRTARHAFRTGGEALLLAFRNRKRKKAKLAVLCDVSGSMDLYSRLLLQFLHALQNEFNRVETFVFSTRLRRITPLLAGGSYGRALGHLTREVREWSGGTRIGECLTAFNEEWGTLVDRRTLAIVLSDGWDTGEPELLDAAMARLKERAGKVIWLNPLLGDPGYEPLTRGMRAALPHVDVFAPAHNLESLRALARHLVV